MRASGAVRPTTIGIAGPSIRVEETAQARRTAFAGALEMLDRLLERYWVRQQESRRRPKKFYVAKRLLWGGAAA